MTFSATPSDDILLRYAAGTLDPAVAVLVRVHLETSPESRSRLAEWEAVGGALLASEDAEVGADRLQLVDHLVVHLRRGALVQVHLDLILRHLEAPGMWRIHRGDGIAGTFGDDHDIERLAAFQRPP